MSQFEFIRMAVRKFGGKERRKMAGFNRFIHEKAFGDQSGDIGRYVT